MPKPLSNTACHRVLADLRKIPPPTKVDIDRCKVAAMHCQTLPAFADFLEVDVVVLKYWINTFPKFKTAFQSWREYATYKVEQSLAKRAIGFTKKTKKQILTRAGNVVELVTEEYYPPSETAAALWLKNRAKEDWKDTQHIDVNIQTDIRAWLVSATGDNKDDSEIIDVTPTHVESLPQPDPEPNPMPDIVGIQEATAANLEPISQPESKPALEPDLEAQQPQPLNPLFKW